MQRIRIWLLTCITCLLMFMNGALVVEAAGITPASREKVRVGFFEFDGYHMMNADGVKSGYGYDLTQMLARYANLDLEYVGYDKGWNEMQQMLRDGEIDMVSSAHKTPEREREFAFSYRAIGYDCSILSTRMENKILIPGMYQTYNGIKIGMLRGSTRVQKMREFAAEKGFSFQLMLFDNQEQLTRALREETVDAISSTDNRDIKNELILDRFAYEPFYIIVRKDRTDLLKKIDDALFILTMYRPSWRAQLYKRYYTNSQARGLEFTNDEKKYLEELRQNKIVFKVAMNPDKAPYAYFDEQGNPRGILVDLFDDIARKAGISYRILPAADREEYWRRVQKGEADIDLTGQYDYGLAQKNSLWLTNPYLTAGVAMIRRTDFTGEIHKVVMPKYESRHNNSYGHPVGTYPQFDRLPSVESCVQAVKDGQADAAFLLNYIALQKVREDYTDSIQMIMMPAINPSYCLAVSEKQDYRMLSVLNKCADNEFSSNKSQQLILKYTTGIVKSNYSLRAYFYRHPGIAAALAGFLVLVLAALAFTVQRHHAGVLIDRRRKELERFVSYVCQANDIVQEVDMTQENCINYNYQVGQLTKSEHHFRWDYFRGWLHPETHEPLLTKEDLLNLIEQQDKKYYECIRLDETGKEHWYSLNLQAIPKTTQHPCSLIVFIKDIQQVKERENAQRLVLQDALNVAQRASLAKGNFVANMSHEIRTPLNAIIGYLSLLDGSKLSQEERSFYLRKAGLASRQLLQLINDILDFSAIESGRFKIADEPFSLREMLDETISVFMPQAQKKDLQLLIDSKGLSVNQVRGDQLRVKQILYNLLSNALKFTPSGGRVVLSVQNESFTAEQVLVRFQVADTGIGMSGEYQKRIFEPFEQESAGTARKYGGSGLGLSITNNLVHLMHGSIAVVSQEHKGTTFTVTLPFPIVQEQQESGKGQGSGQQKAASSAGFTGSFRMLKAADIPDRLKGLRVLLVEDNAMNLEISTTVLKKLGLKVTPAADGQKAAAKFRESPPGTFDFILMDIQMPVMNGYQAAEAIRNSSLPEAKTIPIIAVTADVFPEDVSRVLASGMNGYISKPVDYHKLMQVVAKVLGEKA